MSEVKRIYVEKKNDYQIKANELYHQIINYLGIKTIEQVRILICYDIQNLSEQVYKQSLGTVFSEPPLDSLYEEKFNLENNEIAFGVEFLPGQFDQRADSAVQCLKLLNENEEPIVRTAVIYVIKGELSKDELNKIKDYCINPVDSREANLNKPKSLMQKYDEPNSVEIIEGFIDKDEISLQEYYNTLNLAMTLDDFFHIYNYFKNTEKRNPSITEIRVLDTYWSDHCRHTTFLTELKNIKLAEGYYRKPIEDTYLEYTRARETLYVNKIEKYISLIDIALIEMKKLKAIEKNR